ncbi:MAG: D-alanyl-D-alanine carboxypeptidase precursor [Syntrophorhabdaceae bacterium PtaU1.Bin034]|nr:MAG: D-alanyl-D-alanine carboxypeptidase precursor [Syntrophorhabdaceae bacterium PtaU1.Bin034]
MLKRPLTCLLRLSAHFFLLLSAIVMAGCGGSGSDGSALPVQQLQTLLNNSVSDDGAPGAILAVQSPAGTWVGAAGKASLMTGDPMTPDMQVRLASVTKPLTALLVMKLVEDNILHLNDTVERWLPGLIPRGSEMTVEMLLSHRAGVYSATELESLWNAILVNPTKNWTSNEIIALVHDLTPMFTPGETYYYSNTGYYLLGMIVEAATGNTLSDEIERRIFNPLQLTRTHLARQGLLTFPCARGHAWLPTTGQVADNTDWNLSWDWTAGSAVSCGADMLMLTAALFNGRIVSPTTLQKMTTPTEPGGYGLGIGKVEDASVFNTTLIGHTGENPGTATYWYYFPDYRTTIFVAVNRSDVRTAPGQTVPVDGSTIAYDIFVKAWRILRSS